MVAFPRILGPESLLESIVTAALAFYYIPQLPYENSSGLFKFDTNVNEDPGKIRTKSVFKWINVFLLLNRNRELDKVKV